VANLGDNNFVLVKGELSVRTCKFYFFLHYAYVEASHHQTETLKIT